MCSDAKSSRFKCQVARAKDDVGQVDEIGPVDFEQFQAEFQKIDWEVEADRFMWLNKAWPGIAVTNHENNSMLWAVAYRPNVPPYFVGKAADCQMAVWHIIALNNAPSPPDVVSLETLTNLSDCLFETYNLGDIEDLFALYFADDYDALYHRMFQLRQAQE